ncbi:hypothetical protein JCM12141A_59120 [Mycolicibacterium hodleri]
MTPMNASFPNEIATHTAARVTATITTDPKMLRIVSLLGFTMTMVAGRPAKLNTRVRPRPTALRGPRRLTS